MISRDSVESCSRGRQSRRPAVNGGNFLIATNPPSSLFAFDFSRSCLLSDISYMMSLNEESARRPDAQQAAMEKGLGRQLLPILSPSLTVPIEANSHRSFILRDGGHSK